jgi:hypothetical protein
MVATRRSGSRSTVHAHAPHIRDGFTLFRYRRLNLSPNQPASTMGAGMGSLARRLHGGKREVRLVVGQLHLAAQPIGGFIRIGLNSFNSEIELYKAQPSSGRASTSGVRTRSGGSLFPWPPALFGRRSTAPSMVTGIISEVTPSTPFDPAVAVLVQRAHDLGGVGESCWAGIARPASSALRLCSSACLTGPQIEERVPEGQHALARRCR